MSISTEVSHFKYKQSADCWSWFYGLGFLTDAIQKKMVAFYYLLQIAQITYVQEAAVKYGKIFCRHDK